MCWAAEGLGCHLCLQGLLKIPGPRWLSSSVFFQPLPPLRALQLGLRWALLSPLEQWVPPVAVTSVGKQETTARGARLGSACARIYKKENLQILAIFVKMSTVHFQQQWLCSHRELSFPSSLPWCWAFLRLADALSLGKQCRHREGLRWVFRGELICTLIYRWGNDRDCPGLARL